MTLGILLGLIAPLIAMALYYCWNFSKVMSFAEYERILRDNKSLLTGVSTISLASNAIFFTIYINSHRDKTAKGIFVATLIYGISVLLYKMIK